MHPDLVGKGITTRIIHNRKSIYREYYSFQQISCIPQIMISENVPKVFFKKYYWWTNYYTKWEKMWNLTLYSVTYPERDMS